MARARRDHGLHLQVLPHRAEATLALVLVVVALLWALGLGERLQPDLGFSAATHRSSVVRPGDTDGDGLADAEEDALLRRYAPRALLSADDPAYPASIRWVRERTALAPTGRDFLGVVIPARAFPASVRRGSRDPRDWTVYGHAYPRSDGGVELQYWFYYAFNKAAFVFDHESDWEHVSVELDARRRPIDFALAAHHDNSPGRRVPWAQVPKEGDHPWFCIASGTHAAYLFGRDAPFWEKVVDCPRRADGTPILAGCPVRVIRSGEPLSEGGSPLVNVGERGRPRADGEAAFFRSYQGLWGSAVPFVGTAAPYGPPFQRSFCVDAKAGSCW